MTLRSRFRLAAGALAALLGGALAAQQSGVLGVVHAEPTPVTRAVQFGVEHLLRDGSRDDVSRFLSDLIAGEPRIRRIRLLDQDLQVLADAGGARQNAAPPELVRAVLTTGSSEAAVAKSRGLTASRSELVPLRTGGATVGVLEVSLAAPRASALGLTAVLLAAWVVAAVLVFDSMVLRLVTRPLAALQAAMGRLGRGEQETHLPVTRRDEVGDTAQAFNELVAAVHARRREDQAATARAAEFQHELRRTETLGFAGKFASALGHEISTPLNVIAGRIAIARTKLPPSSSAREDLNIVLTQTERIGGMIRSLLEPLRVAPPNLAPTDVRELVGDVLPSLRHLADARSVDLRVDIPAGTPRVLGDRAQLRQVLMSLLANAVETAPAGGQLTVSAQPQHADDRTMLELSVHDSGSVLPPHLLARIFDPVFPTKTATNDTSLALSTARDVVRGHSGELSVDSEAGAGTTFTCWLPVIEEDRQ